MTTDQLQNIKSRFGIIGNADLLNRAIERAYMVAPTDYSVLVTGEATPDSDIDLLVDKGGARYLSLCGLSGDIYQATGKLPDVYDISQLKDGPFRDEVLREAVAL